MPNVDGGHYFLTVLAPLLLSDELAADGSIECPSNMLRKLLALMPTTGGGPEPTLAGSEIVGQFVSPFARNRLNHFARFAVIEDVNYNGRINGDGLFEALKGINPAELQAVDHLSRPYLLFAAEFDPNREGAPEPDVYLDRLWQTMEVELRQIFGHCYRFVEVQNAGDFVRYIKRCQVETTMPFNDYWIDPPPFKSLRMWPLLAGAIALAGAAGFAVSRVLRSFIGPDLEWSLAFLVGIAVLVFVILFAIRRRAVQPFATAPGSDLATILKALYLQKNFVDFAITNQGGPPDALSTAFGDFLKQHRPREAEPSQPPAVVSA
ncbi:MAG: hypothetical protein H0W65_02695 [Sphingomonas sp.]|uniref:hypothetical protein n=1 Tax=Sphingomonas sp. TaxID=28214 RepID=UPI0017C10BD6|nr:hypothetical protein [Sphingomonas sp.]MBA3666616.1 hypothetical protein [Sphingomonas sp.]